MYIYIYLYIYVHLKDIRDGPLKNGSIYFLTRWSIKILAFKNMHI